MAARSLPRKIAVLAAGLTIALSFIAPSPVAAAYTGLCVDSDWGDFSFQHVNERDHAERFTGVIMDVTAQVLMPCTYSSGWGSATLINATLQRGPNHVNDIAQIGLVRCSRLYGCGGHGPDNAAASRAMAHSTSGTPRTMMSEARSTWRTAGTAAHPSSATATA